MSLLDEFMPEWDIVARHEIVVDARPPQAWQAVIDIDLGASPLSRLLFAARGIGYALRRGRQTYTLADLQRVGFVPLGKDPPREVVLGLIGRFWRPMGGIRRDWSADGFTEFAEPGYAKAAWNFTVTDSGSRSLVATETRVVATDEQSLRSFRRYWLLVRPFSALTRREALKIVKREAERP